MSAQALVELDPEAFSGDLENLISETFGRIEVLKTRVAHIRHAPGFDPALKISHDVLADVETPGPTRLWGATFQSHPEVPTNELWICGNEGGRLR